jgi:hypothetical protein
MPRTMLRLLQQSHDSDTAYPFACAVINVVHRSVAALHLGQLDAAMRCGGYQTVAFHRVVANAVCRFVVAYFGFPISSAQPLIAPQARVFRCF